MLTVSSYRCDNVAIVCLNFFVTPVRNVSTALLERLHRGMSNYGLSLGYSVEVCGLWSLFCDNGLAYITGDAHFLRHSYQEPTRSPQCLPVTGHHEGQQQTDLFGVHAHDGHRSVAKHEADDVVRDLAERHVVARSAGKRQGEPDDHENAREQIHRRLVGDQTVDAAAEVSTCEDQHGKHDGAVWPTEAVRVTGTRLRPKTSNKTAWAISRDGKIWRSDQSRDHNFDHSLDFGFEGLIPVSVSVSTRS